LYGPLYWWQDRARAYKQKQLQNSVKMFVVGQRGLLFPQGNHDGVRANRHFERCGSEFHIANAPSAGYFPEKKLGDLPVSMPSRKRQTYFNFQAYYLTSSNDDDRSC